MSFDIAYPVYNAIDHPGIGGAILYVFDSALNGGSGAYRPCDVTEIGGGGGGTATGIAADVRVTGGVISITGSPFVKIAAGQQVGVTGTVQVQLPGTQDVHITDALLNFALQDGARVGITGSVNVANGISVNLTGIPYVRISGESDVNVVGMPSVVLSDGALIGISGVVAISGASTIPVSIASDVAVIFDGTQPVSLDGVIISDGALFVKPIGYQGISGSPISLVGYTGQTLGIITGGGQKNYKLFNNSSKTLFVKETSNTISDPEYFLDNPNDFSYAIPASGLYEPQVPFVSLLFGYYINTGMGGTINPTIYL